MTLHKPRAKDRITDATILGEVRELAGSVQIYLGRDGNDQIKPALEVSGDHVKLSMEKSVHAHDPNFDLKVNVKSHTGHQFSTALRTHDLVLTDFRTKELVMRTPIDGGTAMLKDVPPGKYGIEVVKRNAKPPGPNMDIQPKELGRQAIR
ncbi:MAG: hypothetical protein PHG85_00365 [Candidatus Altiarchaeota archaeon]|nr:hypothetical protein [Candidatus Altiarchaeota archaeon]